MIGVLFRTQKVFTDTNYEHIIIKPTASSFDSEYKILYYICINISMCILVYLSLQ